MNIILKTLAIVFSLGIIISYSVYKQKQSRPRGISNQGVLPAVPENNTVFSTSKSGPVDFTPLQRNVQFSTSKSAAPILRTEDISEAARQFSPPVDSSAPRIVIPTTKSGVVFKPSDIKMPEPVQQSRNNQGNEPNLPGSR